MDIVRFVQSVEQIVHPVYLVGGSVRDHLLGIAPTDYDFATPLTPDLVESAVRAAGKRAYIAGRRFGTIGFRLDDTLIEITTFRSETYAPRNRKPQVRFVSTLTDDLARRDFTMNAIAATVQCGELALIDPFDGQADISNRMIHAVGNPDERLREDPLRMLRAARFAAQLGFAIDPALLAAITANAHLIHTVSRERWMGELDKLLVGPDARTGLAHLEATGLLRFILPEVATLPHLADLFTTVAAAHRSPEARWAALLSTLGTPAAQGHGKLAQQAISAEIATGIAYRLNWSTARRQQVIEHIISGTAIR